MPSASMTSSETPTDETAELPTAVAREREVEQPKAVSDPLRLERALILAGAVAAGWVFILWAHNFHVTAACVFLWLGWFAVVMGVHNLWRTGTATADEVEEAGWWRPAGAREELEREKKALLKAIKEVDFDHQTGKMSAKDAEAITRGYRLRAIEVIKALDELEEGSTSSVREQIEREVKARLGLEAEAKKAEGRAAKEKEKKKGGGGKTRGAAAGTAAAAAAAAAAETATAAGAGTETATAAAAAAGTETATAAAAGTATATAAAAGTAAAAETETAAAAAGTAAAAETETAAAATETAVEAETEAEAQTAAATAAETAEAEPVPVPIPDPSPGIERDEAS
jgi:hypothetical protein